jgi:dihydroorotase
MNAGTPQYDLLLKGGRVIDPARNVDAILDVALSDGKVAAVEPNLRSDQAKTTRNVGGLYVVPGLIDFHSHVYWGGTSLGVDAEAIARRSGTTTFLDAGSAGPGNFLGFKHHVIERSAVRILSYLNISFAGIFGVSKTMNVGECEDLRLLDANECVAVAQAHPDTIRGIKFRTGRIAAGNSGMAPMVLSIEVAGALNLPVMAHIDAPPPSVTEVFRNLRPGDIFTHCFKPFPSAPLTGTGDIRREVLDARNRGVIFDIGHGRGAFTFPVARAMLDQGFLPDVISSDVHVGSVDGPAYDLLVTMSKFLALGLPLRDIVRSVTQAPAKVLRRPDLGTLAPGAVGDAVVLEVCEGEYRYVDARGNNLDGRQKLAVRSVIIGGALWHEAA